MSMPLFYDMDMMFTINGYIKYLANCFAILFMLAWSMPMMAAEQITADLRLLIDVSGSMKKNDPQNLRIPAVRLLVGMMPENTYSGIWTFGQRVTPVLAVSRVDKNWRRKARSAAGKIKSREIYTDIEKALRKATSDWTEPDPRFHRNIILLTDGLVDVSKEQTKNEASRRRIVEQLLPRIAASGAKLHTIALSANSDHSLMERLSATTGGWYEQVDDANALDRLFLRLFEQSTTPDTLPLKNNRFTVDSSISDMTVLAFRYPVDESFELVTPHGKRFSVRSFPANVRWLRETNYDLVTVENPSQGEWQLDGPEDPDNRVTVVTNLRLEVDPMPTHFTVVDAPTLYARLQYDSTNTNRPDFLDWVQFSLHDTLQSSGEQTTIPFSDKGEPPETKAGDGTHSAVLGDNLAPGQHELTVVADGGSFSREYRQMVRVYAHVVEARIVPGGSDSSNTKGYRLDVQVEPALLQTETLQVLGYVKSADTTGSPLKRIEHDKWQLELPAASSGDIVELEINGLGRSGNPYHFSRRLRIDTEEKQAQTLTETERLNTHEQVEPPPQPSPNEVDWGITVALVFIENLLFGLLAWLGYRLWKKRFTDKEKPDTDSEIARSAEAMDSEVPESRSEPETEDVVQSQASQPSAEQPSDINAETEDEGPPSETSASVPPTDAEQGTTQADPFIIEEFDEELNATLEAWENQSEVSQFSDAELETGDKPGNTDPAEESAAETTTSVGKDIEIEVNEAQEDTQAWPETSDSMADASQTDEAQTDADPTATAQTQQGEIPQEEIQEQLGDELDDILVSEAPDINTETLSIDLSDDTVGPEEEGEESTDTEIAPAGESSVDDDEQDLLATLQTDPDTNVQEEIVDNSEERDNVETVNTGATDPKRSSIEADDDPDVQHREPPEESQNMAR